MSAGALDLHLTDLAGEPVRNVSVELLRFLGSRGRACDLSLINAVARIVKQGSC